MRRLLTLLRRLFRRTPPVSELFALDIRLGYVTRHERFHFLLMEGGRWHLGLRSPMTQSGGITFSGSLSHVTENAAYIIREDHIDDLAATLVTGRLGKGEPS